LPTGIDSPDWGKVPGHEDVFPGPNKKGGSLDLDAIFGEHCNPATETILEEVARITSSDRQKVYGHPLEDWTRTAKMWSAILGVEVTAAQCCLCMVAVKVSRLCKSPLHRDSVVDVLGYARCYAQVQGMEP
jgi:hypothetical protein